ncbi:MAG: tyrosine-type recombinase/integrase [Armatimonadetes bacterium]|nr:tyrosine-type recombinase/integrase [Armatimonadota bacterium]
MKRWQEEAAGKLEDSVFGLTLRQLRRIVERAADIVGIPQRYKAMERIFSPHSLRHAFATHSYENGMRVLTLKKLLGHEFLGTTEIYIFTAIRHRQY